jgi:iron complex transport system permease protein
VTRPPLTRARLAAAVAGLALVALAAFAAALALGPAGLSPRALWDGATGADPLARAVLLELRLPRALAAALLGAALALAGTSFQALLRNPLADPYVLGVSGGASLGGVLALLAGASGALVPAAAFLGALGALVGVERIATAGGRLSVHTLLLTGAIFNAFAAAFLFFLQSVASLEELHAIVFYLMGRVPTPAFSTLGLDALVIAAVALALYARARSFNALGLGEEGALALGVDVERLKRETFVLGSLLTAIAVAQAGMIGFVGLIVPHLLRLLWGPDHRLLLPASAVGGAAFLVLSDLAARTLVAPRELPVGVVTALVGGPFFLVLLRRRGVPRG